MEALKSQGSPSLQCGAEGEESLSINLLRNCVKQCEGASYLGLVNEKCAGKRMGNEISKMAVELPEQGGDER